MAEPPPLSQPAAHGRAAAVPASALLAAADEPPPLSYRSSPVLLSLPAQGSRLVEARVAPVADGRSLADPEDVPPLSAVAMAQAHALPASPTQAADFQPLSQERPAEISPGRHARAAAPIAVPHPARSARGQMREVRRTRSMAGRRRRRRRVGGRGRCWGCRRRGLASSPGGRLHTSWCRRRFLRGLRYGADARRRSELREIRPDGRTRHGRVCGFGLSGGRRRRAYRRRGTGLLDDFVGAGKD